jgi:hypothetical protein
MAKAKNGSRPAQAPATAAGASSGSAAKGNRPVKEFRLGRVRVSLWANTNSKGESWFSAVLTRSYKDGEGNWKNSHSLGLDDLFVAGEVLKQAALWIFAERQGEHKAPAPTANGAEAPAEGTSDIPF